MKGIKSSADVVTHIKAENPDAIIIEDCNSALVGVGKKCGYLTVAVYDRKKLIRVLQRTRGFTCQEAEDWVYYNIDLSSTHGPVAVEGVGAWDDD